MRSQLGRQLLVKLSRREISVSAKVNNHSRKSQASVLQFCENHRRLSGIEERTVNQELCNARNFLCDLGQVIEPV